jgi:DUF4097 and DUF4098 domain-containing protein YvlB
MNPRKIAIALAVLVLLAVALAPIAVDAAKEKYEEKFERIEKLSRNGRVYLANLSGNITLRTWNKAEVKIDALKTSRAASMEEAEENAALVTIDVRKKGDQLEIRTKYPERGSKRRQISVSIEYTLTIPDGASVDVDNVSGDIRAEGLGGLAKLETVSGSVTAVDASGGGVFSAVSGNVSLQRVAGDVNAKTVSGKIDLEEVSGTVDAETVSGSVNIKDLSRAKSADVSVHSGAIVVDGPLYRTGRYSFQTHSGSVTLNLPDDAAFDFNFVSFSGDLKSEFKALKTIVDKKGRPKRSAYGQVNEGGADVTVETFSGSVILKKEK